MNEILKIEEFVKEPQFERSYKRNKSGYPKMQIAVKLFKCGRTIFLFEGYSFYIKGRFANCMFMEAKDDMVHISYRIFVPVGDEIIAQGTIQADNIKYNNETGDLFFELDS